MISQFRTQAFRLGPFLFLALLPSLSISKTLVFQQQQNPVPSTSGEQLTSQVTGASSASVSPTVSASGNSELFFMLEQLQQEVRELRGVIEEQAHQIQRLQQDGKSRYKDLDNRVLNLTKQVNTPTSAPKAEVVKKAPVSKEGEGVVPVERPKQETSASPEQRKAYQDAYAFIKDKKFDEAIDALHMFLEKYPDGELAGNAYYWLGEVYLVLPQLEQARQAFSIVVKTFPKHRKVADALFKLGVAYDRLQDPVQSEQYLNLVQSSFPESTAAKLAKAYKINR